MATYIRQFIDTSTERLDEKEIVPIRDGIASKWEPVKADSFSSNFSLDLKVSKAGKFSYKTTSEKENWKATSNKQIYDVMPSAMWLYRLGCTFQFNVEFAGPEGYKHIWSASFRHTASDAQLHFYEWKGGFTLGASGNITDQTFRQDVLDLLNYLASNTCLLPYDGVVAGYIA
jgi:hypothetical protein